MTPPATSLGCVNDLLAHAQGAALGGLLALPDPVKRVLAGPPKVVDGNRLGLEVQLVLRALKVLQRPGPGQVETVARARRLLDFDAVSVGGRLPIGSVEELSLGGLAARRYVPSSLLQSSMRPTLLFLHGGAFVLGGLDSHDAPCRFLAEQADVQVIAVDYRLAPEAVAPAALVDSIAAHEWVAAHAAELSVDSARIAVGGDSAGGNLAIGVARAAAGSGTPLAFQLLVYPVTDLDASTRSRELFREGYYLDHEFIAMVDHYAPTAELRADPRVSPLLAEVTPGQAPAYLCTAGFDPLRDEGHAYAEKLAAAGIPVEHRVFTGAVHGFLNFVGVGSEAKGYVAEVAEALRKGLSA